MGSLLTRARDRASATPLRLRLVAILLALALVALAVTGAVAVALLGGQLVDKVDAQVTAVARGLKWGSLGANGFTPAGAVAQPLPRSAALNRPC